MLHIYQGNYGYLNKSELILANDLWFSVYTMGQKELFYSNMLVRKAMQEIDKAELREDWIMDTPYGKGVTVEKLSTGCKTIINILLNPNKIVSTKECGDNAKQFILESIRDARVIMSTPPASLNDFDFKLDSTFYTRVDLDTFETYQELLSEWD